MNAEASLMIRLHWSYPDLLVCPAEHLRAINQLLKDEDRRGDRR